VVGVLCGWNSGGRVGCNAVTVQKQRQVQSSRAETSQTTSRSLLQFAEWRSAAFARSKAFFSADLPGAPWAGWLVWPAAEPQGQERGASSPGLAQIKCKRRIGPEPKQVQAPKWEDCVALLRHLLPLTCRNGPKVAREA